MAITITKPSISLRSELATLKGQIHRLLNRGRMQEFWFVGDGSETDFAVPSGWKPLHVYDAGALQKEGAADEYTVTYDGFAYTVTFGAAPSNLNDVCIVAEAL